MPGRLSSIYLKVLGLANLLFAALPSNAQTPSTPQEIKTDVIAREAITLLNDRKADSIYSLAGEAFQQQVTLAQWKQVAETQLYRLTPFTQVIFKGSEDLVSKYKLNGKIALTLNISLDGKDKIADFSFIPYRDEVKPVSMTAEEKRTDEVAMKVLGYLNTRQVDMAYALAGDDFKKQTDKPTWHTFTEKQLYPLLPFPKAIFIGSKNGINKYKIGDLEFLLSLDKTGHFQVFIIKAYVEEAKKLNKAATDNPMHSQLDSLMNNWLSNYIQTAENVGVSAAVYYQGKDHYYNYGETVKDSHQLPNAQTMYELGSITKTFTATILAQAVNDGLVTLDDHITKFLPDSVASNPYLRPITLKQLANHTSGLPRMPDNIDATVTDLGQPYENYDDAHLFAYLKNYKATRGAGVTYEYSNLGAGLLGVILEYIYHHPYENLVQQYITLPLQLTQTKINRYLYDARFVAQGYDAAGNKAAIWKQNSTKGAGALLSSTFDMLKYGKQQLAIFNGPVLKDFTLTHQSTFDDGINRVGLGWHYLTQDKDPVIQHTGGTGGCRTAICINLRTNLVLVVLTNNATTGDSLGLELMGELEKLLPQ